MGIKLNVPRIISIHVKNYRALKDLELRKISPLTVFLGPNGSGKSTIFDVFSFISECFQDGLRKAWDRRNRFKELRTRGSEGPIEIEIKYKEDPKQTRTTYHLSIDQDDQGPFIKEESLRWRRGKEYGAPYYILKFACGKGEVVTGELPDEQDERIPETLDSRELIAVNALGQLAKNPRVAALRRFITSWYISYLSADMMRGIPEAGPQERLNKTGDNLPNVIQYLQEQYHLRLDEIFKILAERIPRVEKVDSKILDGGTLLLLIKDAPFDTPILAKFASDGTLKMLAYLILLHDPNPPQLMGIEEPENFLHPRLLPRLAEECRSASSNSQLLISTHSPYFVNGLNPEEVWILERNLKGFTEARKASEIDGIKDFIDSGAKLGELWLEGHFRFGDPFRVRGR